MVSLNDYLYSGNTILKILQLYSSDLKKSAEENPDGSVGAADRMHAEFLEEILGLLEHNDFLTSQSQRLREFYKYLAGKYPYLAFTFKGRIKSLIRAEEKFNAYIAEEVRRYYGKNRTFPDAGILKERLGKFRDIIAYRIVIAMPECHLKQGEDRKLTELKYLYEIADALPGFLRDRGFIAEPSGILDQKESPLLPKRVQPYFRDYVENPTSLGYQSLHITFYDNIAKCYIEVQLRTKDMDDFAEIGGGRHESYEEIQKEERRERSEVPAGECPFYDEACMRMEMLQNLDLSKVKVCFFTALDSRVMNDGCGLYRGRLILPYEHLSRFQNDIID